MCFCIEVDRIYNGDNFDKLTECEIKKKEIKSYKGTI